MDTTPLRGLGPRVAQFLRRRYKSDRAKLLARDFKVSTSTAQRWLDGVAPTTAHLEEMVDRWGRSFVTAIFLEEVGKPNGSIEQLLRAKQAAREAIVSAAPPLRAATQLEEAGLKDLVGWSPPKVQYSNRRIQPPTRAELLERLRRTIPGEPWERPPAPAGTLLGRFLRWLGGS